MLQKNQDLEAEIRQLTREVKQHDEIYMKLRDLKIDYK